MKYIYVHDPINIKINPRCQYLTAAFEKAQEQKGCTTHRQESKSENIGISIGIAQDITTNHQRDVRRKG